MFAVSHISHCSIVFCSVLLTEDAVGEGQCNDAEVIIVDPPRRGLDKGVLDVLTDKHPTAKTTGLSCLLSHA